MTGSLLWRRSRLCRGVPRTVVRPRLRSTRVLAGAVTTLLTLAAAAVADVTPITDPAAFQAAVPTGSTVETVDFEDVAAGTVVPSGSALGGITWSHSIAGGTIDLAVGSGLPTTSGVHFLGLDAANVQDRQIQHGDAFELLLPPARAFAMTGVSGDPLLADDVLLVTDQGSAGNAPVPLGTTRDGGLVYFVGLVAEAPFQEVRVRYGDPAGAVAFLYTVDDLVVARASVLEIPTLGTTGLLLLVSLLAGLGLLTLKAIRPSRSCSDS